MIMMNAPWICKLLKAAHEWEHGLADAVASLVGLALALKFWDYGMKSANLSDLGGWQLDDSELQQERLVVGMERGGGQRLCVVPLVSLDNNDGRSMAHEKTSH